MRKITEFIIHCSATREGQDVTAADIRRWHVQGNGWKDIGYHFVIRLDGTIELGRPIAEVGAQCAGHNAESIGICYVGGMKASPQPSPGGRGPRVTDAGRDGHSSLLIPNSSLNAGHSSLLIPNSSLVPADTRTPEQKAAMMELLRVLHRMFPEATVHGHREYARKACPCFDVKELDDNM